MNKSSNGLSDAFMNIQKLENVTDVRACRSGLIASATILLFMLNSLTLSMTTPESHLMSSLVNYFDA